MRQILKKKKDDGYDLGALSFTFERPSLQHERSKNEEEIMDTGGIMNHVDGNERNLTQSNKDGNYSLSRTDQTQTRNSNPKVDNVPIYIDDTDRSHVSRGNSSQVRVQRDRETQGTQKSRLRMQSQRKSSDRREEQNYEEESRHFIDLLDMIGEDDQDQSMNETVINWASRRKSHSIPNQQQRGINSRRNPPRRHDSLTRRERDYLGNTEEWNEEDRVLRDTGFDRKYGQNWRQTHTPTRNQGGKPRTSTPFPGTHTQLSDRQAFIFDKIINSPMVQNSVLRKSARSVELLCRSYSRLNYQRYEEKLRQIDLSFVRVWSNPSDIWNRLYSEIINILDELCPFKKIKISNSRPPYINDELIEMSHHREELYKKAKKSKDANDWKDACVQRLKTNKAVIRARTEYIKEKVESSQGDPKKFWGGVRELIPKRNPKTVSTILDKDKENMLVGIEANNYINSFFCDISSKLVRDLPNL